MDHDFQELFVQVNACITTFKRWKEKRYNDGSSIHSVLDQDPITDRDDTEIKNKMLRLLLFTFVSW